MVRSHCKTILLAGLLACVQSPAQQTLRDAAQLDAQGRCDEAEKLYTAMLARGPQTAALLNNAGNHYIVCGDPVKAKQHFEKLLELNPSHGNANLQLARLSAESKQGKKALTYLERVKPNGPHVELIRAEALYWSGNRPEAIAKLDQLEKASAGNPDALFLIALASARMGLYPRAEGAFNAALALRPGDFDLTFGLGRAAARAQHYDRAYKALEAASKMRPDAPEVMVELGRVCAALQDYVQAVYHLARARQKAPGNPDVLLLLARAAEDAGYYDDASTAYDEYMRLRPGDDTARRDRARAYGQTESRREEARRELTWYLSKHPDDPLGHYAFALCFWWAEPEKALAHLTEAARLDPESPTIRFSRGWMLQRVGRIGDSLPDLEAANRMSPGNVRILDLIGLAHLAGDRPKEAEKSFRDALAIAPDDPEVVLHTGRALMAQGREQEAQEFLERYRKIRPQELPGLRKRVGMIELATLSAAEQRKREIERYRVEAAQHPDRPDYQLHLASLLLADGKKAEALHEFKRLSDLNANAATNEQAGDILLTAGEYALAREFLSRAIEDLPGARANLAIAVFHQEGADAALGILKKYGAGEPSADELLLEANLLELSGRPDEATRILNQGQARLAVQPRIVQTAVSSLLRLKRPQDAVRLLEQAIRTNPQDSELPLSLGLVLSLTGQPEAAEKRFIEVQGRWPEWWKAYLAHGLLLEQLKRTDAAKQKVQTAAALGPNDSATRCALKRLGTNDETTTCACGARLEELMPGACAGR
jgi:tetratricopeptide (TPR) repeat protein